MKEKLQKYLAGEREGFSLVELIIVIAIMAILVGVVTLAVLPNIAKSRESKDISALDSVLSATNNAIASAQVSRNGSFDLPVDGTAPTAPSDTTAAKVQTDVMKLLGKTGIKLESSKASASGNKISVTWTVTGGTIGITVKVVDSSSAQVASEYNDNGSNYGFCVTN